MTVPNPDILQGWKDIAAYIRRDIRTVRRWEKRRGLPVRRTPGEGRANVYALASELDQWLINTPLPDEPLAPAPLAAPPEPAVDLQQPSLAPPASARHRLPWIMAACLVLASGIFAFALHAHRLRTHPAAPVIAAAPAGRTLRYASSVPGVDDLYLRGQYFYDRRTPDTLPRALQCFQDALAKDPGYAPAWSGAAKTYVLLYEYSVLPAPEAFAKARDSAQRAIALDPRLTEAHASLGFVDFFWSWDAAAAAREFHTAIALDRNDAMAHSWFGAMLTRQGRFAEALSELDIAQQLDPASTTILGNRAFALGLSGHRNEAVDMLLEAGSGNRSAGIQFQIAALSLMRPRNIPLYLDQQRRIAEITHNALEQKEIAFGEAAYRSSGERAMWKAILDFDRRNNKGVLTAVQVDIEAELGEPDTALQGINVLIQQHDPWVIGLATDPMLVPLHHDPRFARLLPALGLSTGD